MKQNGRMTSRPLPPHKSAFVITFATRISGTMGKNLVIVESPAKAKTIEGYLGGDFVVRSSYGQIRDLLGGQLAVDVENGFMPTYELTAD